MKSKFFKGLVNFWIGEELLTFKRWIHIKMEQRRFRHAVRLAIEKHRTDGKTYYVIQGNGFYKVWNSDELLRLKKAGVLKKKVTCLDTFEQATYVASSNKQLRGMDLRATLKKEYQRIKHVN